MTSIQFNISNSGERLLTFLKGKLSDRYTTKQIKWLVEHQRCQLNGGVERFCSTRLVKGDIITLHLDFPSQPTLEASRILFEDESVLFYNKPAYLSAEELSSIIDYPLVHRLDRDTTGVMVFAKSPAIKLKLEELFKKREIKKKYFAWVSPAPKSSSGTINLPLEKKPLSQGAVIAVCSAKGKEAITDWKLQKKYQGRALLALFPKTGRTHQLRAHLKAIGSAIVGDLIYGGRNQQALRPLLHAYSMSFSLEGRHYQAIAPLPEDFY